MPGNARAADLWGGICCCHVDPPCVPMAGPIITYSGNTVVNGRKQARLTDITIGYCGHPGSIVTGSPNTNCNSLKIARCTDVVAGCNIGTIITCSDNVITNG